jgi:hypothetical protein
MYMRGSIGEALNFASRHQGTVAALSRLSGVDFCYDWIIPYLIL